MNLDAITSKAVELPIGFIGLIGALFPGLQVFLVSLLVLVLLVLGHSWCPQYLAVSGALLVEQGLIIQIFKPALIDLMLQDEVA